MKNYFILKIILIIYAKEYICEKASKRPKAAVIKSPSVGAYGAIG